MAQALAQISESDEGFIPNAENARLFRNALGSFTTGVTVVTAMTPAGPIGMTANSFSSLSLDPPLVLWSPAKGSSRYSAFIDAQHFCINVLSAEQDDVCKRFAKSGHDFQSLDWEISNDGVPVILGSLSRFECSRHAVHDGGDHSLIIGRVMRVMQNLGSPLCFSQGQFGQFTASA